MKSNVGAYRVVEKRKVVENSPRYTFRQWIVYFRKLAELRFALSPRLK